VHGLSCLVTAYRGDKTRTVLFDTGPEDYAFERNVTRLGVDLGVVGSIVLSHGHWDHAGAMLLALGMIRGRNGARDVPFYAHPGMFVTRGVRQPNGTVRRMDDVPSVADLTDFGARMVVTTEPQTFLDGLFYVSGEIPRLTPFERGYPGQMRRTADGWEPDELLMDERWLAVNVAGKGLVVLSACSHAGIVNVCKHVRATFPDISIHAVVGGLHLSGPNEEIIPQTVAGLREFGLGTIAAGHCTGWRAMTALANAFGDTVLAPTAVGKQFTF
jgi:7,8-dihydropterin-6-yl-methyl-4-(beta-D-ribofuranosyl)aminobenzene 5'-phosphate synthase